MNADIAKQMEHMWAQTVAAIPKQHPSLTWVNPELAIAEGWITREEWDSAVVEEE